jgi:5-methylcytosine-specific restriction protein B
MALNDLTSRDAVVAAIAEFDRLGRDAFLEKYRYGRSRRYFVVYQGRRYDSKAIAGAAHAHEFGAALKHTNFSGGEQHVVAKLRSIGFEVVAGEPDLSALTRREVVDAIAHYREVGREAFMAEYGGGPAAKFLIRFDGDLFDAKAVLVVALRRVPGLEDVEHGDVASTRAGVAEPLRRLGFDIEEREQPGDGVSVSISGLIQKVMDLQDGYTPQLHAPNSQERLVVLSDIATRLKVASGPEFSCVGGARHVLGSDYSMGAGNVPRVPWVRLTDPAISPSAQAGWYVVLLFAFDGQRCYLSLNQGTTGQESGRRIETITSRATAARTSLAATGENPASSLTANVDVISLDNRGLGRLYEVGHVAGVCYDSGRVPSDDQIVADARALLSSLARLYEQGENVMAGETADVPASHVMLKWSAGQTPEHSTIDEHAEMIRRRGKVVLAKIGKPLALSRVEQMQQQLAVGAATRVYLLGGQETRLLRANLVGIEQGLANVDQTLIPEHYRAGLTGDETCFIFDSIDSTDLLPVIDNLLVLQSNPGKKISESLSGQTTVFYVWEKTSADQVLQVPSLTEGARMQALADSLNWTLEATRDVVDGVRGKKRQMILTGPPGTGKTFVAEKIGRFLTDDDPSKVRIIQFHQSYGYEDFVEGLRPVAKGGSGFEFDAVPGVLLNLCKQIEDDGETRVLIIDEINRANIARVFGELLFLLEYRDKTIHLMLNDREFSLPDELIIIGTMNTADRNIRSLDVAMRRRFKFFELLPDETVLRKEYVRPSRTNSLGDALYNGFRALNEQLVRDIDRHHTIGHSYFLDKQMSGDVLRDIWKHEIYPLIEDYFFDQPETAERYTIESFWPDV